MYYSVLYFELEPYISPFKSRAKTFALKKAADVYNLCFSFVHTFLKMLVFLFCRVCFLSGFFFFVCVCVCECVCVSVCVWVCVCLCFKEQMWSVFVYRIVCIFHNLDLCTFHHIETLCKLTLAVQIKKRIYIQVKNKILYSFCLCGVFFFFLVTIQKGMNSSPPTDPVTFLF